MTVKRNPGVTCGGPAYRERGGDDGIGSQSAQSIGAVEIDEAVVDPLLRHCVCSGQRARDLGADIVDRLEHASALEPGLIAVPQLPGFMPAGRGTRRRASPAGTAVGKLDIHLNGGPSPRVKNLARMDAGDARGTGHEEVSGMGMPISLRANGSTMRCTAIRLVAGTSRSLR